MYRVARVVDVCLTGDHFTRPDEFDLGQTWLNMTRSFEQNVYAQHPAYPVRLAVSRVGIQTMESRWSGWFEVTVAPTDTVFGEIRASFDSYYDALGFILSMGTMIRVLDPPELAVAVRQVATEVLQLYAH